MGNLSSQRSKNQSKHRLQSKRPLLPSQNRRLAIKSLPSSLLKRHKSPSVRSMLTICKKNSRNCLLIKRRSFWRWFRQIASIPMEELKSWSSIFWSRAIPQNWLKSRNSSISVSPSSLQSRSHSPNQKRTRTPQVSNHRIMHRWWRCSRATTAWI